MTRTEKLTYVEGLETRIAELEDQVRRQAERILTLAGVDVTKPGFDARLGETLPGLARMAAGMKLPTTTKSVPPALAASTPKGALPAERPGVLRMAAGLKLPRA